MYCGIDLGTTNIKVAIYNHDFQLIDRESLRVEYIREKSFVEFDAMLYAQALMQLMEKIISRNGVKHICQITLTGQAETLVVLGKDGVPLINAISWMDERSIDECEKLSKIFAPDVCEAVTGQRAVLPTWPATKVLWLKKHCPEVFAEVDTYMLLKDYVVYYLTGVKTADMSIATFSFYFDIYNKRYWKDMLGAIGITEAQLPTLSEPCTVAGCTLPEVTNQLGLDSAAAINIGTLDHFAGMVGTGNVCRGGLTLSTGTVTALAVQCQECVPKGTGIAMHYGFVPNTYIALPVMESGGVSLEWFRRNCIESINYDQINKALASRKSSDLLFLPHIVGTNAPEFDGNATGVFWGLRQKHDAIDMAGAIMEGVAYALQKNCLHIIANGIEVSYIIATGGGSKSPIWCQMYADITGIPVCVPAENEAACLGAAIISAVADGRFGSFKDAADNVVTFKYRYEPRFSAHYQKKYRRFCKLYDAALEISGIG